jgi:aspartate carbamoyltransferase catalytic subunit
MNRGVEVTAEVADSERSVILDQVQNGVALRCAVLARCAAARPVRGFARGAVRPAGEVA